MRRRTFLSLVAFASVAMAVLGSGVFPACTKGNGADDAGKKALLIILDGWGIGDKGKDDVISQTDTPYLDYLTANYPHSQLQASGEYVGLPDGQMGNSETGGVHSSLGHLLKLLDIAKEYNIPNCYVHCFMDGRDTDPRAGKGFIADVQQHINKVGTGAIATVIGRYYAMDRDKHWDRIKLAYYLIVNGKGLINE